MYARSPQTVLLMPVGETLTYSLNYLGASPARFTLHMTDSLIFRGHRAFRIEVEGRTGALASRIFRIDNRYTSVFERETGRSLHYAKDIAQKNLSQRLRIDYFPNEGRACFQDSITWAIGDSTYDFFAMIYFLRRSRWEAGDTLRFTIDTEERMCRATAAFSGLEKVKCGLGRMSARSVTVRFSDCRRHGWAPPRTDILTNRLLNFKSDLVVHFSDDERRLPLRMEYRGARKRSLTHPWRGVSVKAVLSQLDYRMPGEGGTAP